ncbi:hypothetical protein RND81_04G180900 [Saponaria officinalis]|uniref:Uncharacterized protein n=1 Tax=Saponaria officinalis TaxID=3572 RepID=A0AAW1LM44_SAPOF
MSFSSSKSTSKKPNSSTTAPTKQQNPTRNVGPRRSRSVSAFSRTHLDITSDFSNTRVNPLFWADGSDSSDQCEVVSSNFDDFSVFKGCVDDRESRRGRGRSVTRNSGGGERKFAGGGSGGGGGGGRSLSTVDTARRRRRSPSQGSHRGNYERERKQESSSNLRSTNKTGLNSNQSLRDGKNKLVRSASDLSEVLKGSNTWSSQHPAFETSDDSTITSSDRDRESGMLSNTRNNDKIGSNRNQSLLDRKSNLVRSSSDLSEVLKGSNTWSSQHPVFETEDDPATSSTPDCNSETSTRPSVSEVEERTLKPVSEERKVIHWEGNNGAGGAILETVRTEVRRAISDMHKDLKDAMLRSDSDITTDSMFSDVAPDPNALDLVSDFREEFTRELEECEIRTRKLRAELAIEEHREFELNQILSDMIPEPETPQVLKPYLIRKGSTERRTMSKRLEEEAMAYFDECVSISTFDDSDFSSLEDPPSHKAKFGETADISGGPNRQNIAWSLESQDVIRQSPHIHSNEASNLSTSGISNDTGRRPRFSFTSKLSDTPSHEQGIRNHVKSFSKDKDQQTNKSSLLSAVPRKSEIYDTEMPVEKYLLDKMTFRSRIESGGMLLCGGGSGFCRAPFSSNFW